MDTHAVRELKSVNEKIKGLNDQLNDLKQAKKNIELGIIDQMNTDSISLARTDFGTVSITKTDVASVTNWAEFEEYIYENRALYLLQRRASNPAYRDEVAAHGNLPGVETFTDVRLSLTNKAT